MNLENRTALVTGGAVRVGRAITMELLSAGAQVICQYHSSEQAARSLEQEAGSLPGKLRLIQGDLTSEGFIDALFDQIEKECGTLDVLVNNAALFFKTPLGKVTSNEWDLLFDLNLKAAFFCAQHAGGMMKQKGSGKIINIGDPSGLSPWPSFIPYGLTKSGIIAMTKGLAKALAPEVQVNCINPGPVMLPDNYSEQEKTRALEKTLLKREGTGEDIARTVRFLIEGSDYITGAIISVDGGRSLA
jgi:NAD(P)-dependent dehydrogenase (short-subunit alcohol dehydrogenase family)